MRKRDFFFGEVYEGSGGATLRLSDMEPLARKVSAEFFTAQLDRMLKEHDGQLTLSDETSYPSFWSFIDKVDTKQVGYVEIYARQDVNDNVKATLACDIVLVNGVITVKPHWCAYKDIRADEVISTLLVPLHLKALQDKTYIRWDDGETEHLLQNDDYQAELENVFSVAKYPSAMSWGDTADQKVKHYKRDLECATDVGRRGVSSEQAWDAYRELRHNRTM
ncbi:hypothetical protein FJD32_024980 (plasmid) [Shewanella sp. LC6]|uniref:hypothetical protein n=1 Tax=unclassified Shewanella TaxID=196818 RepID=UPI00112ED965|nr:MULTISPECIES: hypothetical protein [unclassified Shewanella]QQK62627.1 hypothetical protein FJD32_024980 [Shewanella sp. LC6]TPE64122.1 hypothetical protein FJD33_03220 [Shewanella sp. LC2]